MNLSSARHKPLLSHQYHGKSIYVSEVLYKPIRITAFEIVKSPKNEGKMLLVAQVGWNDGGRMRTAPLMTESFDLISTIKGTESELPHITKITRSRDGQYHFSELNQIEINSLKQ